MPISRMYMRTGSVVRPNSLSMVASAAAASSVSSSSALTVDPMSRSASASGGTSCTAIPISLIIEMMSSICSGSTMPSGRWSLTSE